MDAEPVLLTTLTPIQNSLQKEDWLRETLQNWLDQEFISDNHNTAQQTVKIFVYKRPERENDPGSPVTPIVTEM